MKTSEEYTTLIKHHGGACWSNFLHIGRLLKEVKDGEIWKDRYNSFDEYLEYEKFPFHKSWAYNLIRVISDEKLVHLAGMHGLSKACELLHVSDKKIIEVVSEKLDTGELKTRREVQEDVKKLVRFSNNMNEKVTEGDDPELKCSREGRQLIQSIISFKKMYKSDHEAIKTGIDKFIEFASKYPENKEIDKIKGAILMEWQEVRI